VLRPDKETSRVVPGKDEKGRCGTEGPDSLRRRLRFPGFYTVGHQDHADVAVGFFAIFAEVACMIPLARGQIAYEKTAHFTKPDGSM
jgi:hypothetical protein